MDSFNSAVRLLDRAAKLWPKKTALDDGSLVLTYEEYRLAALRIGAGILTSGGEKHKPVVVFLPKGAPVLISFMGAMYAGCPYAPVAANSPAIRLEKIIESLRPGTIITTAELKDKLPATDVKVLLYEELVGALNNSSDEELAGALNNASDEESSGASNGFPNEAILSQIDAAVSSVKPNDPIYIIYTSGSTGNPKGVTQTHIGVIRYAKWLKDTFGYDENTVMANQAPFYFDNSVLDI